MVYPDLSTDYYKDLLKKSVSLNIEDAIFRNEKAFCIANLKNHLLSGNMRFSKITHTNRICSNGSKGFK